MNMKKNETTSNVVRKIIFITVILVLFFGISVLAENVKINTVKITFSNGHEITVLTSKTNVQEILDENHILLASDELVLPTADEQITDSNEIIIYLIGEEPTKKAEVVNEDTSLEAIIANYENITEEIVTLEEVIPFETITKDVSNGSSSTKNSIIQYGKNGLRKVTYKIMYKDDVEISREELSSEIIKESVDKIVQIQTKTTTSRSYVERGTSGSTGVYKVTAYCACAQCCGKTNGITASGTHATANRTIAAPKTFSFGTKLVINGQTYVVEDRGGAIQGNRIDIYMDSHQEALAWGVRYLEVEVVQ